jgi:hypothetical protein
MRNEQFTLTDSMLGSVGTLSTSRNLQPFSTNSSYESEVKFGSPNALNGLKQPGCFSPNS